MCNQAFSTTLESKQPTIMVYLPPAGTLDDSCPLQQAETKKAIVQTITAITIPITPIILVDYILGDSKRPHLTSPQMVVPRWIETVLDYLKP